MNAIDRNIEQKLAQELDIELNSKVVPFAATDAEIEVDRIASVYRRSIARYDQRISDTARSREATIASIEANMQAERDRHDAEMARLSREILASKDHAARQIAADKRLRDSAELALSRLAAE